MSGNQVVLIAAVIVLGIIIWVVYSSSAGASPGAVAVLAPMGGSAISGSANFMAAGGNTSTTVTVRLHGLQPGGTYAVTIDQGSCEGPRLFILAAVNGDQNGEGSGTATVPGAPTTNWYVAVHASASVDAPLVACGQVRVANAPAQPTRAAPYQLPNGGGAPPRTPLPTPAL